MEKSLRTRIILNTNINKKINIKVNIVMLFNVEYLNLKQNESNDK